VPWVRPSVGGGVLEPQPVVDVSQKSRPPARFWPRPEPIRASWTTQRGQNLAGASSSSRTPAPPPPGASPCRGGRPCAPATRAFGSPGTSRIWRSMVITRTTASRGVARATPGPLPRQRSRKRGFPLFRFGNVTHQDAATDRPKPGAKNGGRGQNPARKRPPTGKTVPVFSADLRISCIMSAT